MALLEKIGEDTKTALKASVSDPAAKVRLGTLRLLSSEIKYKRIALKKEKVDDQDIIDVINSMVKKRHDAIALYQQGNRPELAAKEQQEIVVLKGYLPVQLDDAQLTAAVDQAIRELGADSPKQMGQVMGLLVPRLKGRAEPSRISALVKRKLTPPPKENDKQ